MSSKYAYAIQRIRSLKPGESVNLPRYANDAPAMARLRSGIVAVRSGRYLRVSICKLNPRRGLRITRRTDWPGQEASK